MHRSLTVLVWIISVPRSLVWSVPSSKLHNWGRVPGDESFLWHRKLFRIRRWKNSPEWIVHAVVLALVAILVIDLVRTVHETVNPQATILKTIPTNSHNSFLFLFRTINLNQLQQCQHRQPRPHRIIRTLRINQCPTWSISLNRNSWKNLFNLQYDTQTFSLCSIAFDYSRTKQRMSWATIRVNRPC